MLANLRKPASSGLEMYLSPGDTVVDVGANRGILTKRYADIVGEKGRVIACEPLKSMADKMRASFPKHVTVVNVALDAYSGTRAFYESGKTDRSSFWPENILNEKTREHQVTTTTLDELLADYPLVHGIKIDAQGAEVAILAGATKTLQRPETTWMLEVWPQGLLADCTSPGKLADICEEAGLVPVAMGKDPARKPGLTWDHVRDIGKLVYTNVVMQKRGLRKS